MGSDGCNWKGSIVMEVVKIIVTRSQALSFGSEVIKEDNFRQQSFINIDLDVAKEIYDQLKKNFEGA
tara:strand:- start:3435 stop:3635 length:201 start_codon:yes stop_codon:yes gene_type:complete